MDLARDDIQVIPVFFGRDRARIDPVDEARDGGHRGPEVVRNVGKEHIPHLFGVFQRLRHVVERLAELGDLVAAGNRDAHLEVAFPEPFDRCGHTAERIDDAVGDEVNGDDRGKQYPQRRHHDRLGHGFDQRHFLLRRRKQEYGALERPVVRKERAPEGQVLRVDRAADVPAGVVFPGLCNRRKNALRHVLAGQNAGFPAQEQHVTGAVGQNDGLRIVALEDRTDHIG